MEPDRASDGGDRDAEPLWTLAETARFLRVPVDTVYQWVSRGIAPRSYRVGRHRRFDPRDVRAWLAEHASDGEG